MDKIKYFLLLISALTTTGLYAQTVKGARGEVFTKRVVASDLYDPWEITWGPDNFLWVTESKEYKVVKIHPETGEKNVILNLTDEREFPRYDTISDEVDGGKKWPQGGLMGMALHPKLLTGKPFVYLCYVNEFSGVNEEGDGCADNYGGCFYNLRIVRYEYDAQQQILLKPLTIIDSIPQSNDHNSGRLAIGEHNKKPYLFYSVGDMGAGQHDNVGRPNFAQDLDKYEGKILRFNLEPDKEKDSPEFWIPKDNPFNDTRRNAVWSYGHRNAQGLAFGKVAGREYLYSSEHGPFGDDEINIIEKGKNYGHPYIIGYNDNNYNGFAAGVSKHEFLPGPWNTTYPTISSENSFAMEHKNSYKDPIMVFNVISNDSLESIFQKTAAGEDSEVDWPALAPGSIAVYTSEGIPHWKNSLLVPSLKEGKMVLLKLNAQGNAITGTGVDYFNEKVRYRDVEISPDGKKIYLSTDKDPTSSSPSENEEQEMACKGCIIEFSYMGKEETP